MGEFDCYCFLCSGPLVPCSIGSASSGHLNYRRRRVERKLLAIEAGQSFDSISSGSDHDSDYDSDDEEVYVQDEQRSYDPEIATAERTDWLVQVLVLGLNPQASGDTKAFISGRASYDDAGLIYVEKGVDPNQPSVDEKPYFDCYVPSNDNEVVFPFHTRCMVVLEEAFQWTCARSRSTKERSVPWAQPIPNTTNQQSMARLNFDTLYNAVLQVGGVVALKLDYGGISGVDQCWESIPGEEFSVIDPLEFSLDTLGFDFRPTAEQEVLPFRTRASVDPFQEFPTEILHAICGYLPGHDLRAFLTASITAYYATLDPVFWRSLCASRMPWAWELWRDIPQETATTESKIDYKGLYLGLDINISKRFGTTSMSGWMGITNRRRVWDVCLQLLQQYRKVQG